VCAGERVAAVIALTERAVLPAGAVRAELGLPGLDGERALLCRDKVRMKRAVTAAGVRCTDWELVSETTRPQELASCLGLPLVLKPRDSAGGRGVRMIASHDELRAALRPGLLAERRVLGHEMSLESFVHDGRAVFTNATEYLVLRHANLLPASLPADLLQAALALQARAHAALGIERGITHLELYLTAAGLVFGELAVRPPGGRIMSLLERAYGFDPWQALLRAELGLRPVLPSAASYVAGAWVLHPGAGMLLAVEGVEEAAALPGVVRMRVRVAAGERISERLGSGQDVGGFEVVGSTRDEVADRLLATAAVLRFHLG
jgi:biotin carboxylase